MPTTTQQQTGKTPPPPTIRHRVATAKQHAISTHRAVQGISPQVAPYAAMGALVLAAAALNAAKQATAADADILAGTAATCVVVAVVAAYQLRRRLNDKKALHRGLAFIGVAAAWLPTVTAIGLSMNAVAVLVALGTALSLHWWRDRRIPNVQAREVAQEPKETTARRYINLWADRVGAPNCTLPGSVLDAPQEIASGWQYVLRLVPGKQSVANVLAVMVLLRGALHLTADQDLIVERHPTLPEPNARLTVVTTSPIKDDVLWTGPDTFQDGRVRLGPYTDGIGHAHWTVYKGVRMKGGFVQGGSNAGKTRLIESIALPVAASETHPTVIWYGDGQGNASSPMLMKYADWGAQTFEQIGTMYACALLVMELRQDENGLNEDVGFTPTADRPGLLLILSECHKPLSKLENPLGWEALQKAVESVAREGGKVGIAEILETQESTLGAFGGAGVNNSPEMIRSNLLMGNGVMMRSLDANAKSVFKVNEDPSQFPELPGYGLMVSGDSGGRTAPFRGYHVTDELRAYWAPKIRWRSLDTGSGNAAGKVYLKRRELADAARDAIRRRVEARRNGSYVNDNMHLVSAHNLPATGGDGAALGIAPFPVWDPAAAQRKLARDMQTAHHKVLEAIRAGITSPTPIAKHIGYSERQVHNLLDELMDDFEMVQRAARGTYVLVKEPTL